MIKLTSIIPCILTVLGGALPGCAGQTEVVAPPQQTTAAPPLIGPAHLALSPARSEARQPRLAGPLRLRPDHPQAYLVRPDDTMLQVAGVFLEEPWRWPELWRPGPGRAAESLYPGEVIELYYDNQQPRLRPASGVATLKLSPQVRAQTLSQAIPAVPKSAIAGFLKNAIVVSRAEWQAAPAIVGNFDDRTLMDATRNYVYAVGIDSEEPRRYRVFQPTGEYRDPATGQSLGFGGAYVGDAVLEKAAEEGKPAVLAITDTRLESRAGDRLFPVDQSEDSNLYSFTPKAPPADTTGWIISLLGRNVVAGQYQSVVINLGAADGMEVGDMLGVYTTGRGLQTQFGFGGRLPSQKVATLMLYRVYDRVSYGLITEMRDFVRTHDRVGEP
ncbi:MAG TPA: hypothetical protein VES89_03345 [Candidatus Competibacteraceae bacterium]|nr:hypothetical protein [Candidatus Competibacteraceae bacterium]